MRRAAKVDDNQKEIVSALRRFGASILIVSQLKNCFDILVGYKGVNYIMEIKDGKKPPSQRKLSDGEINFKNKWKGGDYYIVCSIEDAINVLNK
jgi:hypothetical protein